MTICWTGVRHERFDKHTRQVQDRSRAITAIFGTGPLELEILPTFWGKLGKINILLRMPFSLIFIIMHIKKVICVTGAAVCHFKQPEFKNIFHSSKQVCEKLCS